ncbi:D-alanyl-D-alanine carboxypeptidase family protein [Ferviditalea candida]|uniref:serine-type D-Ala-D-Ala carboxypeptidase n=1 Tax=Ferviditalea candida TaxID=3108399 RepID=A0ABU5ZJS4_9BACL|nr:D-alanyl-D-alanine carboxypeptidase family protein [Paenibacillaceae bacterium T2]
MFRKHIASLLSIHLLIFAFFPAGAFAKDQAENNLNLAPNAKSAILMDEDTGTVIYEKNSHDRLPPASITKIMTMLLVMEAVDQGKIKLDDKVTASEHAASMGGSQIFLEPGEEMTVRELLKGVAMASGNDASVALAEKIGGTEEMFVQMMNEKAQQLGMKDTHFANSNGLPAADHYSSAYDIALMSRELLKYQGVTEFTGKYQDYLRQNTDRPFWLVNTNKLVRFYSGADGLKTGYTSQAKFCLAATAKRGNFRVVSVVMGEPNTKTRNAEVAHMLNYAFSQYTNLPIFKAGEKIGSITVEKGDPVNIPLVAKHQYSMLVKKGENPEQFRHELNIDENLKAPIQLGQQVGKLEIYKDDKLVKEFPIESPVEVKRAGWWAVYKRTLSKLFFIDRQDDTESE